MELNPKMSHSPLKLEVPACRSNSPPEKVESISFKLMQTVEGSRIVCRRQMSVILIPVLPSLLNFQNRNYK